LLYFTNAAIRELIPPKKWAHISRLMTVNPPPPPKTNTKTRISSNMRILSERNGDVTRLTPFS
jgi:hypothetical protein